MQHLGFIVHTLFCTDVGIYFRWVARSIASTVSCYARSFYEYYREGKKLRD